MEIPCGSRWRRFGRLPGGAAALTRQLLAFSRRQQLRPQPVDLNDAIHGVEKLIVRVLGPEHKLFVQLPVGLDSVLADRGKIEQVLMNLAANARDAMKAPGSFMLSTACVEMSEEEADATGMTAGRYVVLTARDTGAGMSAETRARLFEPFFTTKDSGSGTGLGLATVYGIVEQSRGRIRVDSEPGRGAAFTIYFPAVTRRATPRPVRPVATEDTLLLVDDEKAVRTATARLLRECGYEVIEAADASEALQIVRKDPRRIGMLLTDMNMPGLSGRELADIIRTEHAHIGVAIMSGFMRDSVFHDPASRSGIAFVEKPFTLSTLTAALREASRHAAGQVSARRRAPEPAAPGLPSLEPARPERDVPAGGAAITAGTGCCCCWRGAVTSRTSAAGCGRVPR